MGKVVILGSASAVPDVEHENTHILVESGSRVVLVDCPGTPSVRLEKAGYDFKKLTDIILTHFHPDHVSGFASLLMSMWLVGRKEPINVYGLSDAIERAKKMMDLYDWGDWPNFFPVQFIEVPEAERALVLEDPDLNIYASPVEHLIPAMGLRFEFGPKSGVVAYSCDTRPSQIVRRLSQGADVLIHEATGASTGHTSPEMAGEIATQAEVKELYLIHYPPQLVSIETLESKAKQTFAGPVKVAKDFMTIELG